MIQEMVNSWLSAFIYSDFVCSTQRAYAFRKWHACRGLVTTGLGGQFFGTDNELQASAESWLKALAAGFYDEGIAKLVGLLRYEKVYVWAATEQRNKILIILGLIIKKIIAIKNNSTCRYLSICFISFFFIVF